MSARFDQLCDAVDSHRRLDPMPSVEGCNQRNGASWWAILEPTNDDLRTISQLRLRHGSHLGGRLDGGHDKTTIDQWLRGYACPSTHLDRLVPRDEMCQFHDVVEKTLGISGSKTVILQSLCCESP